MPDRPSAPSGQLDRRALTRPTGVGLGGVVENMSGAVCGGCGEHTPAFGSGGGEQLAEQTGAPESASAGALSRIAASLPTPRPRGIVRRSLPLSVVSA